MEFLLRHRARIVWAWILIAALAAPGMLLLKIDNSPELFFVRDAEQLIHYRQFQMDFGRDRAVRIVIQGLNLWTPQGLQWLRNLETGISKLAGVFGAGGLYTHHRWRLKEWPPADINLFRNQVLADKLDLNAGWASADGKSVSVLAALYKLEPSRQRELLSRMEALLSRRPAGLETSIVGLPVIQRAGDRMLLDFNIHFLPLLFFGAILVLFLFLRRVRDALLSLSLAAVSLTILFGIMGYARSPFNLISSLIPPLLFVVSFATTVHVLLHYRRYERLGLQADAAVSETYREKGWPVVWTGLTTMAGFGSLATAQVPPVQSLGIWAAVGMALITAAALTFLPALLAVTGRKGSSEQPAAFESWAGVKGKAWSQWSTKKPVLVGIVFAVAAALALAGAGRLREESNVLSYFPADHPDRTHLELTEKQGIGVVSAELILCSRDKGDSPFLHTQDILRLSQLSESLREVPGILGVVSAGDLLEDVTSWRVGDPDLSPAARTALDQALSRPETKALLSILRTADGKKARVSLLTRMGNFRELWPVYEQAETLARHHFPGMDLYLTGQYPLVLFAQKSLLRTMMLSLSLTFGVIGVLFIMISGSLRLAIRLILPNLFPVACVLGAMGWLSVPVDSTTLMVASVVLGLAVDDTLHTLGSFRRDLRRTTAGRAAVATLERTAPAHVLSSLLLIIGFGVCGLASFVPIARFALLTCLAIAAALVADLFLVPALLAGLRPKTPRSGP